MTVVLVVLATQVTVMVLVFPKQKRSVCRSIQIDYVDI
jgi:hypothetical protein